MELTIKGNPNYVASVVSIKNIVDLEGCDNIKGTTLFGCHVIISKDVKVGDVGLYFPVEVKISDEFLSHNNLFDKPELNRDKTKKGFFSSKGRVRCVKLRGFASDGFWIPIESLVGLLNWDDIPKFKEGDSFDHVNDNKVCEKYVVATKGSNCSNKTKETKANKKFNRIIPEIFKFHTDTEQLGKNVHKINPGDLCSISQKLHGSSFIVSNVLCKKELTFKDKIAKVFGVNIKDTEFESVHASRKVIKNKEINKQVSEGYYGVDIWGIVNEELKGFLQKGMTLYGEVVGYLPNGKMVQKNYDYGCKVGEHKNFIYRITTTNEDGKVFEWPMIYIEQWCKLNGLNCVSILYYGTIHNWFAKDGYDSICDDREWRDRFLQDLTNTYLEKKCTKENFKVFCNNDVFDEGIVIRKECLDIEAYKYKSFEFLQMETKNLDMEIHNIEDEN